MAVGFLHFIGTSGSTLIAFSRFFAATTAGRRWGKREQDVIALLPGSGGTQNGSNRIAHLPCRPLYSRWRHTPSLAEAFA
jgi:hypothetical protein